MAQNSKNQDAKIHCPHFGSCGGCSEPTQLGLGPKKKQILQTLLCEKLGQSQADLGQVDFFQVGPFHFRERMEISLDQGEIGFYAHSSLGLGKAIYPIDQCPLLVSSLEQFFNWLCRLSWPTFSNRVSLRLRTIDINGSPNSPKIKMGLWIDCSHKDLSMLLQQQKFLKTIIDHGVVLEVGQRHYGIELEPSSDKNICLRRSPELSPWNWSYFPQKGTTYLIGYPIYGTIASFTQTGGAANQAMVQIVMEHCQQILAPLGLLKQPILELFCGHGTFTFLLSSLFLQCLAVEYSSHAERAIQLSQQWLKNKREITLPIQYLSMDLLAHAETKLPESFKNLAVYFVDPPRSGLGHSLRLIEQGQPKALIYVSCNLESFMRDAQHLQTLGLKLKRATVIDQFPYTDHFEIISTWTQS